MFMFLTKKDIGMIMHHHAVVVLAGAAAHFATGWVLNCDMFLGKIWKHEKDKKACGMLSKDMRINMACQVAASIAIAIATCIAISVFEKSQVSALGKSALEQLAGLFFGQANGAKNFVHAAHTVLFIWAGFLLPVSAQEVIWCGHNWKHWMLESVADLLGLLAIAATVNFLS